MKQLHAGYLDSRFCFAMLLQPSPTADRFPHTRRCYSRSSVPIDAQLNAANIL